LTDLTAVLSAIQETGAIEYARRQAGIESRTACEALAALPDTPYRRHLLDLADFAVNRTY
jgi:octaprenyl-diphosphate synthase